MKKALSILLSLIMVMTMLPTFAITASAAETNSLKVSDDGILTWDAFGDTGVYEIYVSRYTTGQGALAGAKNITDTKYNLQSLLDRNKVKNGYCSVRVMTKKNGQSGLYQVEANELSFHYVSSLRKLPAPTNLVRNRDYVTWDAVPNATEYIVKEYSYVGSLRRSTTTSLLEQSIQSDIDYVEVIAVGNGYRDSNPAESEHDIHYADEKIIGGGVAPYNVQMTKDGVLSWNAFGDTGVYDVDITHYGDGAGLVVRIPSLSSTSVNVREYLEKNKIDNGCYNISVRTYEKSIHVSSGFVTYYYTSLLPKLSEPQNVQVYFNSQVASWDEVPNADYYKVTFYSFNHYPMYTVEVGGLSASIPSDAYDVNVVAASNGNYRDSAHAEMIGESKFPIIAFDFNGAGYSPSVEAVGRFNRPINLYEPLRNHYNFDGWYTSPVGGTKVDYFTSFEKDTTIYAHWVSDGTATEIPAVNVNGTIRIGDTLNDDGPLGLLESGMEAYFNYSKDGKLLPSNAKATYGNYSCTINLFADDGFRFTNKTVLNFGGNSYKPENIMNNGEIAVFEIPNIYVECPHASSIWGYNTEKHWLLCPTCGGKYAESYHNYSESISGSTITYTCTECGFKKEGKVAETRTAIYRPYIDFGTAMVGDSIPTTVKLDYANTRSGSEKYYNYATVQSVKYSTTGTFKNEKTTVTVVLKANEDYYFESIALPTAASSCYAQYTRESKTVSEDGTTLTAVFSFTPYTTADVTLTLPAEFSAGKTYAEIAKEVQFKVNGVAAKDYSVLIKKAGESSWTISNISNGVVSEQYMYESVIEPNTEYELGVNSNINGTYAKSLTITNKNVAVITDSYYGEAVARVNANYSSTEGHNYDAGTITKQATCTEDGLITFKCTDTGCKSTKTMVIPAKGHQATTAYEIPATCVDEGKTAGTVCSRCDTVLSGRKPIAPTGEHYYSIIIAPEVKPTCTKDGKEAIKRCAYCMDTIGGGVLKATGVHNYSTAWSTDSTNHWHACSCGAKKSSAAHTFKTTVTNATMSADGKKVTKCTICGYVKSSVVIKKPSTVTLSTSKYTYDGKVKKPSVTVKDNNGKTISSSNYTVTYPSGRKNVGKYTYKLTFKGVYTGTKSVSFTIVPKSTSISSLTAASKAFTVKWKKQATQTTGYQIQIATDSKFTKGVKSYIVTKNSTVSKKITSLSAKKKYYIKIRTYKTVSGTRYYSSWSSVKSITTK